MRVVCPSCNAAYQLDEARIPDRGASVKCSRCQKTFPVKKQAQEGSGAVPLPGAAGGAGTSRTTGAAGDAGAGTGSIPLPPPTSAGAAAPRPRVAPAARAAPPPAASSTGSIPLPPPGSGASAAPGFPPSSLASPFDAAPAGLPDAGASPFDAGPSGGGAAPFGSEPFAGGASPFGAGSGPFAAGDSPFGSGDSPFGAGDSPFEGGDSPFTGGASPFAPVSPATASPGAAALVPPPPPAPAAAAGASSLSFGEVDLSDEVADAPPPADPVRANPFEAPPTTQPEADPFDLAARAADAAVAAPRPSASQAPPPPSADDDLEMLFGEGPAKPAAAPAAPRDGGYHVRRRSGKTFGPFQEAQILEMLSKGELLGNEDVSTDGAAYSPIASVPAFGAALRKAAAEPVAKASAPAAFGNRMASAKVVEGTERRPLPRWVRWAAVAAPVVLVLAVGVGAGFTSYGFFFTRLLQRGDPKVVAGQLAQARASLARGDFASERAALDQAARAVAAAPRSSEAAMVHALAVATLEARHGAPPEALAQARKAAESLERSARGEVPALATQLAMALCADPVAATPVQEQALEVALAKRQPDAELLALLTRSALARGDGARAAAQAGKLAAVENGPRSAFLKARAALLRKAPDARATLEKLVATQPDFPPAQLELAALDEEAGNLGQAQARLQPLVADAMRPRLAPGELARALAILGSVTALDAARAAEADKLLSDAVAADPRQSEARIRLVRQRLRRGDAAGAVAATDPVAKEVASVPDVAAVRVRSLAAAGRALDAAELADQALARTPGRTDLLLAKACALEAAGRPDDARAIYADVAKRDPAAIDAPVALARYALAAGDPAKAAALLAPALGHGSRAPAVHAVNGEVLRARGDAAGAEAAYRKALEIDPMYAPAELGLARLALARGDTAAARAILASAAAHDPRNAEILVENATLLWRSGELDPAQAGFAAALEVSPKHAVALARLGAVLLQKGDVDGAIRYLTAASNEAPNLVEARLWLGRALVARSEAPAAVVQLKRAVDLSRNAENLLALGAAYEKARSLSEALEAYKAAAAVAPSSSEPHERIAILLSQNGRCDEALAAYARAIELDPKLSRLRLGQAECTAATGKHEEAVKLYHALLKSDPGAVRAYFLLARSLDEWKGMAAALPWYERAAREEPGNGLPHYYLGYAYKEKGQRARAVAEFRAFLDKKPDAPERKDIEAEIEDLQGK